MSEAGPSSRTVVIAGQGGVQTDLDLDSLADDEVADVIPDLLADYSAECKDWTLVAGEHWRQGRWARSEDVLIRGLQFFGGGQGRHPDLMALVNLRTMRAHLHLAQARQAPKVTISYAKYDKVTSDTKTKDFHYTEATANLNDADKALQAAGAAPDDEPVAMALGKIVLFLARGQPAIAHPLVERLLQKQPNNVLALLAQARLQFARRAHEAALQTYQSLLSLDPDMKPDPRIGIGLCFWVLENRDKARTAWERSLQIDPESWTSLLLLGLASLNTARQPSITREERLKSEAQGVAYVQRAFKLNNRCAASALALATISGQGGQLPLASKLSERAIQYSDNKRHTIMANAERGRLGYVAGDFADAGPFIAAAKGEDAAGVNILAELTLGQIAIKNGNLREALNFIEQTAKRLNGKGPLEYTVLHACLLAYPHPGMKDDEIARNRATARSMLSELHQLVLSASNEEDWARLRGAGEDVDIFLDLAKLWQNDNLDKAISSYQTAVSVAADKEEGEKASDLRSIRTLSNLGALFHLRGNYETAERMYQEALQKLGSESGKDAEVLRTELAFNLGRALEEEGDDVKASQWYRDVLRQHPEHMESKVRLAMLAAAAGRNFDAHILLKECLKSDETNVTLRTVYSNFLINIGSHKEALAFTSQTLKHERSDAATYCALGWLHFTVGREAKTPQERNERQKQYLRSAEAYERALTIDPNCATAAQGLAIALAEDTLTLRAGGEQANPTDEAKARIKLAGQALSVFSRIADSLSDGSVNVNIGHCHFTRGEEEKAIQAYEAALNAYKGQNVAVLQYLARAWYAYATRESNYSAMSKGLSYCQKAMHLQPSDRTNMYNIAMIQQKAAEMLFALESSKRTLDELQSALKQAQQAANTFRALAEDRSGALPYDVDLAEQRARYGDGLLRRAPGELEKQRLYEGEAKARVEEARRARAEEQARIQAAEHARRAEIEAKAAELAEQRRQARDEAMAWQEELNVRQAEDETRKATAAERRKRKKERGEIESADDGEGGGGDGKKRRGKGVRKNRKIKSKNEVEVSDGESEAEAQMSGGEGTPEGDGRTEEETAGIKKERREKTLREATEKRNRKKRAAVVDPDEEDPVSKGRVGKQFKSKAVIEDSDEEAGGEDSPAAEGASADEEMDVDDGDVEGGDEEDPDVEANGTTNGGERTATGLSI